MDKRKTSRRALFSGFAALGFATVAGPARADADDKEAVGKIVVKLRRFRNTKGKVRVGLYRSAQDWPKHGKAFRDRVATLDNGCQHG
jgi:uncharacterized protein (DUF2141 family)